jgi:hypothetical protein
MVLLTRVSSAKKGTKSLKTTVPEGVAEFLELFDKDELDWKMDFKNNEHIAIVKKKKTIKPRLTSNDVRAEYQNLRVDVEKRKTTDLVLTQGKYGKLGQRSNHTAKKGD